MVSRVVAAITLALFCFQLTRSNKYAINEENFKVEVKCSNYRSIDVDMKRKNFLVNKSQVEEVCYSRDNKVFTHPRYPSVYQLVENHLLQAIIDMMTLWKRRRGLFLIDITSGIDAERDQRYFQRSNIDITLILVNETTLKSLQDVYRTYENVVIVCNEKTTEEIVNKTDAMNLFNSTLTWMFSGQRRPKIETLTLADVTSLTFFKYNISIQNENHIDMNEQTNDTILLQLSTAEQMAIAKRKLNQVLIYDVFYGHYRHKNEMIQFAHWTPTDGIKEIEFLDEKFRVLRLRGKSIRTAVFEHPPYSYLNYSTGILKVKGYVADIYDMVMDTLNMRYTPQEAPLGFGMGVNGTYTGVVGIMYRKEAEMTMNVLAFTISRMAAIRYAGQLSHAFLVIGYIRPKPYVPPTAYWLPFQLDVWITTLLSLIVLIIAIGFGVIFSPSSYNNPTESTHVHTKLYRVISGTFFDEVLDYPTALPSKIFYGVLLVSTMMVFSYYTSVFTAFLAMLEIKIPFKDMEDVLSTKQFRVLYVKSAMHQDRFRSAKTGLYARVWKKLQAVGDGISNFDQLLWTFYQGRHVYLADGPSTFAVTYNNCTASFTTTTYMYDILNLATRNDFPYVRLINNIMLKIRESGLMDYLTTVYHMQRQPPCPLEQSSERLGLEQAIGIYILFATGIGLSLFALSIEKIAARKFKNNYISSCIKKRRLNKY